ncbi:hypothetical protein SAMN04489735_10784 [Aneurinibacillus thermoaerophilus]|uniref:Uncharacterized protein n=1 Tax=Aneurinibacillus thermoaerophilus TaxID=143495 RepID=A0A1G8FQR4_ANETH|nr:hypothetical protein [Aneurinibacillus thermoaerophilus]SDH84492.1 hypothetical protein SAMN04489735_10784 [Aneurinibacillus thermoaerophilus]
MNIETRFALWVVDGKFVRLANIEGANEYTDMFANYEIENGRPINWTVCMDDEDEIIHGGKAKESEKAADIRELILEWVARYGVDIRYKPQYILSPFVAGVKEGKRWVLQSVTEFGEDFRSCEETYIFTFERERTIVTDLNTQTFESYGHDPRPAKFAMNFLAEKFSTVDHTEEQQVWYDTQRLADRIGWDKRKVSTYWRRGSLPFPTTFADELPKWDEEKKMFVGGRSPRWTEKQVQIIMRRLDF